MKIKMLNICSQYKMWINLLNDFTKQWNISEKFPSVFLLQDSRSVFVKKFQKFRRLRYSYALISESSLQIP